MKLYIGTGFEKRKRKKKREGKREFLQSASFATVLLDSDSAGRAAPRQRKRGGEVWRPSTSSGPRARVGQPAHDSILTGLVLGYIEAKFCKKICVGKLSPRSTDRVVALNT